MKAIWKGQVIAESDRTISLEGNEYFPPDSVDTRFFERNDYHTVCPWKGVASYYNIRVNGEFNENAAWYYPDAKPAAREITNYVAFWRGVEIKEN